MSSRRRLGRFEQALTLTADYAPFNVVAVLGLDPCPPAESLERALAGLQRRHPMLAARVVDEGRGPAFVTGGVPPLPLRRVERRDGSSWRAVAEDELNRGFDRATGPLARAAYLPAASGRGRGEIVLTLHHVVVDAPSLATLLEELLAALSQAGAPAAAAAALSPASPPPALPPAADACFPPRFRGRSAWGPLGRFLLRQLAGEVGYRLRTRGRRTPPARPGARCRVLPMSLPPEATAALVRRCRRQRITLASAASAALLLAVVRRRYRGRVGPHRCFVFPDLRPRLRPPVPALVTAAYLSMMRLSVEAGGGLDLWDLSRRIQARVQGAVRRGERFLSALAGPWLMRGVLRTPTVRMGTTAVNYAGPVRLGRGDEEPRVTALHAFVSNFHLGPECTAQVRLFRKCLEWDIVYLDRDMDAAEAQVLADEVRAILVAAGGPR